MKNEMLLHADDSQVALDGFKGLMESFGAVDGHVLLGQARSVDDVRKLMDKLKGKGKLPTVAFVDHKMPNKGDGESAAKIIREISPATIIISLSSDEGVAWGDHNLLKLISGPNLARFIKDLQH